MTQSSETSSLRTLSQLRAGERGVVVSISECSAVIRNKLQTFGLIPGSKVSYFQAAPFGDPVSYKTQYSTLALRKDEASLINIHFDTP